MKPTNSELEARIAVLEKIEKAARQVVGIWIITPWSEPLDPLVYAMTSLADLVLGADADKGEKP